MFGTKHEKVVAVADVGSGSAGFSILRARPDGGVQILGASRSILPLEDRTREQTMSGVMRMLSEAGAQVTKEYTESAIGKKLGAVQEIHAVVRAPWTRASAGRATKQFQKETSITKEMITEAAKDAFASNKELDKTNMLETAVIRVELNEYPTASPIGKKAHRLDVITFESDCDPVVKKGVTTTLGQLFPGRQIIMRSGAHTYLSIVHEKLEHPDAYVIIDMVSEATTIMAVRDGVITHHAVIQEGVRTILRRVTGAKGTPEEIISLMRMVVSGSCSGEECDRLNEALARVEPDLVRVFGEAVGGLMGSRRLPDTLILFAHPDITTWLAHVFARIDFAQFTIPLKPFSVQLLTVEKFRSLMNIESNVQVDTGILVASSFVNMQ